MRYDVDYRGGRPSEGLRRLQAIQTEMLGQFLAFCAEHGLRPFLVAGSAIGAVRHGGFIPWDDDVDVGLMRDDYRKFVELALSQPLPGLFVQTPETDPSYPLAYAKIRKPDTAVGEAGFEGVDVEDGIFIDVFAFDLLPSSEVLRRLQYAMLAIFNIIITSFSWNIASAAESRLIRSFRRIAFLLRPILPWRRIIALRERITDPEGVERSDRAICFEMYGLRKAARTIIAASHLVPPSSGRFGALSVPLPRNADQYLASLFGDFMMPPPEERRKPLHVMWIETGP
jgi:lipopolysaccharide cholinephosphotransferase